MRRDRLLRPHQQPWIHPAAYRPHDERYKPVAEIIAARASTLGLAECILAFGGDRGFHTECRFLRTRIGNWSYEIDSHETPFQSVFVSAEELTPICDLLRDLQTRYHTLTNDIIVGNEFDAKIPVLWYHAKSDRLVWFDHFESVQGLMLDSLIQVHARLDVPFPQL